MPFVLPPVPVHRAPHLSVPFRLRADSAASLQAAAARQRPPRSIVAAVRRTPQPGNSGDGPPKLVDGRSPGCC